MEELEHDIANNNNNSMLLVTSLCEDCEEFVELEPDPVVTGQLVPGLPIETVVTGQLIPGIFFIILSIRCVFFAKCVLFKTVKYCTAKTKYRNVETNIPRKGISGSQSQFRYCDKT
jgi:hypothetical protein